MFLLRNRFWSTSDQFREPYMISTYMTYIYDIDNVKIDSNIYMGLYNDSEIKCVHSFMKDIISKIDIDVLTMINGYKAYHKLLDKKIKVPENITIDNLHYMCIENDLVNKYFKFSYKTLNTDIYKVLNELVSGGSCCLFMNIINNILTFEKDLYGLSFKYSIKKVSMKDYNKLKGISNILSIHVDNNTNYLVDNKKLLQKISNQLKTIRSCDN